MPDIRIYPDGEAMSHAAARALQAEAEAAVQARGCFKLALNGGSTPQRLFGMLGELPLRDLDFWRKTEVFWGDERCVPMGQPGSNYQEAWEAFLERVPVSAGDIHRIPGELGPARAAAEYAAVLAASADPGLHWPRFDVVLLGLGKDGHTASLFPGQPAADMDTAVQTAVAMYEGRPADRVSLTEAVFNSARKVWWMALGKEKAGVVRSVVAGEGNPLEVPALRIRPINADVVWWLDRAAASELAKDA